MTHHSFPTGAPEAECTHCGVRFDSFRGKGCKGSVERELDEARTREAKMREAARELLHGLGEYVRQTMEGNPEWRTGIEAVQGALFEADLADGRLTEEEMTPIAHGMGIYKWDDELDLRMKIRNWPLR